MTAVQIITSGSEVEFNLEESDNDDEEELPPNKRHKQFKSTPKHI